MLFKELSLVVRDLMRVVFGEELASKHVVVQGIVEAIHEVCTTSTNEAMLKVLQRNKGV